MKKACLLASCLILMSGCTFNLLNLESSNRPFKQVAISGSGLEKVAIIAIDGVISDESSEDLFDMESPPNMVENLATQLKIAEHDDDIRAVVLKINSPGGSVVASELIYKELMSFKSHTQKPLIASMVGVAASGGYYVALPCDHIFATPSTITGSIGVIMMYPNFSKLMNFLGVRMEVYKSGENKDILSYFRNPSQSDQQILSEMVKESARDFWTLVKQQRHIRDSDMNLVKTARIFTARQAQKIGLVDQIGYTDDAILHATQRANIAPESTVVVFRKNYYANDNIYNRRMEQNINVKNQMIDFGNKDNPLNLKPGMYMLWTPSL